MSDGTIIPTTDAERGAGALAGVFPLGDCVASTLRPDVRAMHAYAVQPSAGLVKLDAMENPFMLPPALQRELGRRLGAVPINRYPTGSADVIAALARHIDLPAGCALMLGNGSDELISLLAMACDVPGAAIVAPVPGFVMYEMSARLQGLAFVGVPLTADFGLDEAAMLAAVALHRPVLTYLAYPNNPTANLWDDAVIEHIVDVVGAQGRGFVVFDEAYQPFASRSWLQRMAVRPHVLVMRTLSKFGLAGVRVGYLAGAVALIAEIDKVRPPYNVGALNAEATLFALEHADEFAAQAAVLRAERERLQHALRGLPGAMPFPSEANMILVRVPDAAAAFAGMKARGVLVKNVSALHPLLKNCLRLTVGTPEENTLMIDALKASL